MGAGLCVALFIEPPSVQAGPIAVHGDGRDFGYGSDPGASRGYIWISEADGTYEVHMNPTGYFRIPTIGRDGKVYGTGIEWFEPSQQNQWSVTRGENGEIIVSYDLVLSGYLEGAADHINGTIIFRPDGKGGYTSSGNRDGFPWGEGYYRDADGQIHTLFQRPALRGDPYDLGAIEKPQPAWNLPYQGRNFIQWVTREKPFDDLPLPDIWGAE